MTKGDLFWFDSEGIGIDAPLSYFGWDFDEAAVIEKIDGDQITLLIKDDETAEEIRIIAPKSCIERMVQKPDDRKVEWLEE